MILNKKKANINNQTILISLGRFHVFENMGCLSCIISGYPKFKLKDEPGVPENKIIGLGTHSFYMLLVRNKFIHSSILLTLDFISLLLFQLLCIPILLFKRPANVVILSKSGLLIAIIQKFLLKGKVIVEHTSSHPENYNKVSILESKHYNIKPQLVDSLSKFLLNYEFKIANIIVLPTNFAKNTFIKYLDKKIYKKIKVIPIPSNKRFENYFKEKIKNKKYFKCRNKTLNILSISQITPRKGIRYLFDSLNKYCKSGKVNLTLVGNASTNIEKYIYNYKKEFNFKWYKRIPFNNLPEIYYKNDLFILLSAEEGLPNVFKEALYSGLPIIGSYESGISELKDENNNIWSLDKEDTKKISKIMINIASNKEEFLRDRNSKLPKDFNKLIFKNWELIL